MGNKRVLHLGTVGGHPTRVPREILVRARATQSRRHLFPFKLRTRDNRMAQATAVGTAFGLAVGADHLLIFQGSENLARRPGHQQQSTRQQPTTNEPARSNGRWEAGVRGPRRPNATTHMTRNSPVLLARLTTD